MAKLRIIPWAIKILSAFVLGGAIEVLEEVLEPAEDEALEPAFRNGFELALVEAASFKLSE